MRVLRHDDRSRLSTRLLVLLLLAPAVGLLSACATRGGPVPYEPANFGRPDAESLVAAEMGPQLIGPLDKVKVNVFQVEALSGEFQVDGSGNIEFPLIGQVRAAGRTSQDLQQELYRRLSEKYLRDPNVQVSVSEQTKQTITVDGSVRGPGVFDIRGPTTLMRAVALAKGTSEDANTRRVIIFRTVNGERLAGAFDLSDIRKGTQVDPPVYGNDIVIVDGSRTQKLFQSLMSSIPLLGILRPY